MSATFAWVFNTAFPDAHLFRLSSLFEISLRSMIFFERPLAKWLRGFYLALRLRLDLSSSRSQLGPLVLHASHATQSKSCRRRLRFGPASRGFSLV
jgi:hypothetical protein